MQIIEMTPPKFDLHGQYKPRVRQFVHATLPENEKVASITALINQAYQQGKYDSRILIKNNTKNLNK